MCEGFIISLSSDGKVFTVTTADDCVIRFVLEGNILLNYLRVLTM